MEPFSDFIKPFWNWTITDHVKLSLGAQRVETKWQLKNFETAECGWMDGCALRLKWAFACERRLLRLARMLCELMYLQNGDLANLLKSARKNSAPECPFECGWGGVIAIWAMPK